jgi:hypothetical protein
LKCRRPLVSLGLLFFLVGQSLVSTYLPLELVYEHRNYLPSFGVILALLGFLLVDVPRGPLRLAGATLAAGLIGFSGFITFLRADEWSNPLNLAYIEATRHPASPRANYELGREFAERSTDPNGLGFAMAVKSFEVASALPESGLLPLQALIYMNSTHNRPVAAELWAKMDAVVSRGTLASQDVTALYALIACKANDHCKFDAARLAEILARAAEANPGLAKLHTLRANFTLNVAHDPLLALGLMQRAVALEPKNPSYWENLISLQTSLGQLGHARSGLTRLRELDRFGTLAQAIRALEAAIQASAAGDAVRSNTAAA